MKSILFLLLFSGCTIHVCAQLSNAIPIGGYPYLDYNGIFADVNGDGHPDYVSQGNRSIAWIENDGNGKMTDHHFILPLDFQANFIIKSAIDIEGDDDIDILATNELNELYLFKNEDGAGNYSPPMLWYDATILDVDFQNADGGVDKEVLAMEYHNSDTTYISILKYQENDSLPLVEKILMTGLHYISGGKARFRIYDMNNDGWPDIIFSYSFLKEIYILYKNPNNEGYTISDSIMDYHQYTNTNFEVSDFDNDGDTDIVFWGYHYNEPNSVNGNYISGHGGTASAYQIPAGLGYKIRFIENNGNEIELNEILSENDYYDRPEVRFLNTDADPGMELVFTSPPMGGTEKHSFIMQSDGINWHESEPIAPLPDGIFVELDGDAGPEIISPAYFSYSGSNFVYKVLYDYDLLTATVADTSLIHEEIVLSANNVDKTPNSVYIDFNGDGIKDFIYWNGPFGSLNVHYGLPNPPYFSQKIILKDYGYLYPTNGFVQQENLYEMDINSDGLMDVLLFSQQRGLLEYLLNPGAGSDELAFINLTGSLLDNNSTPINMEAETFPNGDTDIYLYYTYQIKYLHRPANEASFAEPEVWLPNAGNELQRYIGRMDADGDTLKDMIILKDDGVYFLKRLENSFSSSLEVLANFNYYFPEARIIYWPLFQKEIILFHSHYLIKNEDGIFEFKEQPFNISPSYEFTDFDYDGYIDAVSGQGVYLNILFNGTSQFINLSGYGKNFMANINSDQYLDAIAHGVSSQPQFYIKINYFDFPKIVGGKVFYDANINGVFDADEYGLGGLHIMNSANDYHLCTNGYGAYQLELPSESVTLQTEFPSGSWIPTTANPRIFDNTQAFNPAINLHQNFGFVPESPEHDVDVYINQNTWLCNVPLEFSFSLHNLGTSTPKCKLVLTLDELLDYNSSTPINPEYTDTSLTYHFTSLPLYGFDGVVATFQPMDELLTGELVTIHYALYIEESPGNYVLHTSGLSDNILLCSYDPNDIAVNPTGYLEEHYTSYHEPLVYKIRFQNTGNYPAANVKIIDFIDTTLLNVRTLLPLESTHTCFIGMEGDKLIADFPNINLPDSSSNLEGSQGFVKFSMMPKKENTEMQIVQNRAYIYFDYNDPIITNIVFNTLCDTLPIIHSEDAGFYAILQEGETETAQIVLENRGIGLLEYNVNPDNFPSWITIIDAPSGQIPPMSAVTVSFQIIAPPQPGGLLSFSIYFHNNSQNSPHYKFQVKILNQIALPLLPQMAELDFGDVETFSYISQTFYVLNKSGLEVDISGLELEAESLTATLSDYHLGRRDTLWVTVTGYYENPLNESIPLIIHSSAGDLIIPVSVNWIQQVPFITYTPSVVNLTFHAPGIYPVLHFDCMNLGLNEWEGTITVEGINLIEFDDSISISGGSAGNSVLYINSDELAEGENSFEITIENNSMNAPAITIPITIFWLPQSADLLFTPELIDFGTLNEDETPVFTGTVSNTGTSTLQIDSIYTDFEGLNLIFETYQLPAGGSTDYVAVYTGGLLTGFETTVVVYTSEGVYILPVIALEEDGKTERMLPASLFSVFPNPAADFLIISCPGLISDSYIRITDLQGKMIMNDMNVMQANMIIPLRRFNAGMVNVSLHNKDGITTKQVLIN